MNTFISAITGIGGHYLNGRWDRAIFFLFFFIVSWGLGYLVWVLAFDFISSSMSSDELTKSFEQIFKISSIVSPIAIALLWLMSIVITFRDNRKDVTWTKHGIIGAVGTSLISASAIWFSLSGAWYYFAGQSVAYTTYSENEVEYPVSTNHNFYKYIFFGGGVSNSENLPEPPKGEVTLRGKFTYLGEPAQGVHLSVVLNSKYKVKNIQTNEKGEFSIKLSQGSWTINTIQTTGWEHKPKDASFFIYSGHKAKLIDGVFDEYKQMHSKGLEVSLDSDDAKIHVNVTIKPSIKVDWPNMKEKREKATIDDVITWNEYPKAESYYVKISKVTKNGKYTNYDPIIEKTITGTTSLPLSSLASAKIDDKKENKYHVKIFAFSKDGTLLGESTDPYDGGGFVLTDGNILLEDTMNNILPSSELSDPKEIEKELKSARANKKRIKAVKVLIDNKMLKESMALLNFVEDKYSKGDKEALTGYIFALQGKCDDANKMFNEAKEINSKVCLPDTYKVDCK